MEIPPFLVAQIQQGKAVIVLGAGASIMAADPSGAHPPTGAELAALLSDNFLGGKLKNRPLSQVAEYAISESSLPSVQQFIRGLFEPFDPTAAHHMLPTFRWWGLATTNYDRLIEKAYEHAPEPVQHLVTFVENGDRVDDMVRDPRSVMLLKLHGCITRTANPACPLILTTDQYIDHRAGRSRLFDHLIDWGFEHPVVFVGHSLQDPDLRTVLKELSSSASQRSRYFAVTPDADDIEKRAFDTQRITVLPGTFDDFLRQLDSDIPSPFRRIVPTLAPYPFPIAERFRRKDVVLSPACIHFLQSEVDYVKGVTATHTLPPSDFYRGINPGFSAVEQDLDVRRHLGDTILSDVFLTEESEHPNKIELILVKAHAGAGKTVLLRRLAWDAAHDYDCLCLFIRPSGIINTTPIQDLIQACDQRLYLFVDDAADRIRELESLVRHIGPFGKFLTVILAERINEWNVLCQALSKELTEAYELRYLSEDETDKLLALLNRHRALGRLEGQSPTNQKKAFEEIAGRQLLVALHEATLGVPFEEIIQNEFDNVQPFQAKQIYLSICVLNRLNVPVRAGIISRIHGVPFEEFKERLFAPLEHVVQAEPDSTSRDYVYRARHPLIAQMVFDRVLRTQEDRYDAYVKCLGALNIDYTTDRIAFRQMVKAKSVIDLFPNHDLAMRIYKLAQERAGREDGSLIHQMALYEMNRANGSIHASAELLARAAQLRPFDSTIKHSQAELKLRFAEEARTPFEREKYIDECVRLARECTGRTQADAYGYVTLAKAGLTRITAILESGESIAAGELEAVVKEVEQGLVEGLQRYPADSYLLEAESQLAERLADSQRAIDALHRAFQANPRNGFIAIRLARCYQRGGRNALGRKVLEDALGANQGDRRLHYAYAKLLLADGGTSNEVLLYHLQRSFSPGDSNFDAQLLYARQLFVAGDLEKSKKVFLHLRDASLGAELKTKLLYPLDSVFRGEITRVEASYCFVARDGLGDWIYAHRNDVGELPWRDINLRLRVVFRIAFNFKGPGAFNLQKESDATRTGSAVGR